MMYARNPQHRGLLLAGALSAIAVAPCSAGPGGGDGFDNEASRSSGPSAGAGAGSGQGGEDFINPAGSGGSDPGETCATSSETATLVPVNMFITVDKSGSMDNDNKWNNTKAAFTAFFQDPDAASLRVALRFWPDGGCDDNTCSIDACSQPQVDIGPLSDPAQVQSLVGIFNQKSPGGLTPTSAALGGATKWAKNHVAQTEGSEKVVVILVTDGEPTACQEGINEIASYAADAWATASVPTFAVGLAGSNESQMDVIAQAGNTGQGIFIGNGNAQAELLAALQAIQKSQVACTFAMPQGQPGKPVDPAKVNVNYTPGDGSGVKTIGQVGSEAECGAAGGWYYDDPADPAIINLCPSTCDAVQGDNAAKIEIQLGCDTKPA